MKTPTASIIIPIYNVETWLDRCIKSATSQDDPNIEIILVDDGSPDHCPVICDQWSESDSRISVIHKRNGGLSSARNAGLKQAKGKYVFFLDSDDWIDPDTISSLSYIAEKHRVDFVRYRPMYANWPNHPDGSVCDFGTEKGMQEGLYAKADIAREIFPRLIATPGLTLGPIVSACRSFYRRDFLMANNLYFDEQVKYSEDTIFSSRVVYATNSFYYLDGPKFYHYFYNKDSISKSFRKDRWESCLKLMQSFERHFKNCPDYDFSDQLHLQKMFCALLALSERKNIANKKERVDYCRTICNHPYIREAFRHLRLVSVTWKMKFFLRLIRCRANRILAII